MDRFNGLSYALRPSRLSFIPSQRFSYVDIESQHGQIETLIYFGDDGRASGIALRPVATALISSNAGFLVRREQTEFACLVRRSQSVYELEVVRLDGGGRAPRVVNQSGCDKFQFRRMKRV
jgi:hypothetical protein